VAQPSITSNQIAIDPISGIFYFKNNTGTLVSSSLNVLQSSNTQITTEDSFQISGNLVVDGDLTVNGTTITINTESIVVEDKNIELGSGITTNANASGGGITLKGATDKTFNWINNTESWTSSENINLASGKVFKIDGTEILSANAYSGSASKWTNARVLTLGGDLSGNVSIDGSANVTLTASIVANSVSLGTDTTGDYVAALAAGTGIALANNSGENSIPTISLNASIDELTDVAINNAVNGDFFRYNGSTWINDAINLSTDTIGDYVDHLIAGTGITITNNSGEASTPTISLPQSIATNANVTFNQVTSSLVGNVTGNVTGDLTGNVTGNVVGNINGNLVGDTSGNHTGNVTGTASNALVWTNQRKITLDGDVTGNVFIDGSANVTITTTIASNSVELGVDTTGEYVANLVSGTGITITDNSGEGMTPVIKVADSYTTNMVSNIANSAASVSSYADSVGNIAYSNAVTYINNRTLDDLSGVTLSNVVVNDFLLYNGSVWINDDLSLNKISDIATSNVLNGQILIYDSSLGKWINSIVPEAPSGTSLTFTKGNNTDTSFTLFHGLETQNVVVTIRSTITDEVIQTRWSTTDGAGASSNNHVTVTFTEPPETDEMSITVYGSVQSTSVVITGRLDNLSGDVMISTALSGHSLFYNGSKWINRKASITTDMSDVLISGNATGQFLKWNGSAWVNSSISTINNLDDVGDVTITSAQNGDLLKWNGSVWVNASGYALLASPTFSGTVSGITKTMVGLGNVDNTSDANKPVSTATQTALDLKANLNSPIFTGTVSGIDKEMVGLGSVANTADMDKPVSTAVQAALDLKADLNAVFTTSNFADASITSAKIADGTIDNVDISSSAAIAYSKLNLSNSVTTTDLQQGVARAGFNSTLNSQTASYILEESDLAKLVIIDSSSNATVTVNNILSNGDRIDILRKNSTGEVTFVEGSGVTINGTPGLKLRAQWSGATLVKLEANTWVVLGDLKA